MGPLFSYALSVAIFLVMGYLMYKVCLAGARQQAFNRFAIHAIVGISLLMPVITHISKSFYAVPMHGELAKGAVDFELLPGGVVTGDAHSAGAAIAAAIYAIGMLVTLLWMLVSIMQIVRILNRGEEIDICVNGITATVTVIDDEKIAPFSWMGNIVMSRIDFETNQLAIMEHEVGHIRHRHSYDMFGCMCFLAFQWFNPAAWLLVEELRTVHEYQADEAVIASGADIKEYQMMLIKKAVGTRFPSPANSLNHSNLKNRITMMYQKRSGSARKAALLMAVPAMAVAMFVTNIPAVAEVLTDVRDASILSVSDSKVSINLQDVKEADTGIYETASTQRVATMPSVTVAAHRTPEVSQPSASSKPAMTTSDEKQADEKVYDLPEVLAEFPGGMPGLMKFLGENIRYPKSAHDSNTQGRVIVNFVVNKDGSISDAKVVKGVSEDLDAEAVRVVETMPAWKPAEADGKAVASKFTIPITFKLMDDAEVSKTAKE